MSPVQKIKTTVMSITVDNVLVNPTIVTQYVYVNFDSKVAFKGCVKGYTGLHISKNIIAQLED